VREAPARRQASARARSSKLDQVIVDRRRGRLHKEDLLTAHGLEKLDGSVAVWIPIHDTGADPSAQLARYRRTQVRVGRAAENHELIVHARLGAGSHANGGTISARFVSSRARQQSKDSNIPIADGHLDGRQFPVAVVHPTHHGQMNASQSAGGLTPVNAGGAVMYQNLSWD
jgi:hypothetical protein